MNTEVKTEQFHLNFQKLNHNMDRLQRKNMKRRNLFVVILLQLSLVTILLNAYFSY